VVTIAGGGFPPNQPVNVYLGAFDGAIDSALNAERYGGTLTDGEGRFVTQLTMPVTWPTGEEVEAGRLLVLVATDDFGVQASALFHYQALRGPGRGGPE
jgi:hypothetical protein